MGGETVVSAIHSPMQVIRLERSDWQFFCPATGEAVFQESGEPNAKSVRGVWVDADTSEALFITPELEPAWEQHKKEREAIDEWPDLLEFLKSVDQSGWVAFEITTCGIACGPICTTTWTILDLS